MKVLKRVITIILIVTLCIANNGVAFAYPGVVNATSLTENKMPIALDGKVVSLKGYRTSELGNYYYSIKEIAKLLKNTKKEFNYRYDDKKKTLTFFSETTYNSKDVEAVIKNTGKELDWPKSMAIEREPKIYVGKTQYTMKVYLYKNAFYLRLLDIVRLIDIGIVYNENKERVDLSTKLDYSIAVPLTDIKPVVKEKEDMGYIENLYPNAELIKNPKTAEDVQKILSYMKLYSIPTYRIYVPFEEFDSEYEFYNEDSEKIFINSYYEIGGMSTSCKDTGKDTGYGCIVTFELMGFYGENTKQGVKENDKFNKRINEVIQEMYDNGELSDAMTETEKARAVFTWVAKNVEYDYESYYGNITANSTAYDALFKGLAICSGYAGLYNVLCRCIGLEQTAYITGEADGLLGRDGHAWSAQVLDGKKVMVDVTFGDNGNIEETDEAIVNYDWFAKPVSYFKKNKHYWNEKSFPYWK